jgi:hypothetical protein
MASMPPFWGFISLLLYVRPALTVTLSVRRPGTHWKHPCYFDKFLINLRVMSVIVTKVFMAVLGTV